MSLISTLYLFVISLFLNPIHSNNKELQFELSSGQKIIGTYSGDIDQKISVHLVIFKDKDAGDHKIRPFFIDEDDNITSLEDVSVEDKPTVDSYHYNKQTGNLSLIIRQGRWKNERIEVIDFHIPSNTVNRSLLEYEGEDPLVIRTPVKTFLVFQEEGRLDIRTIYGSRQKNLNTFRFSGEDRKKLEKIFEAGPQSINTSEFVEQGSIRDSKIYFYDDRLIFDHKTTKKYLTLSLDPEEEGTASFREFSLRGLGKVKEVNAFIHGSDAFVFVNDKKDLLIRRYDLETGRKNADILLRKDLGAQLGEAALDKLIKKSAKKSSSLTATVNEGLENTLLLNLSYVSNRNYNYNYYWWWHHHMFQHQMMMQNMMMQQQMQRQMQQINSFGPSPDRYEPVPTLKKVAPLQLVFDADLNFQEGKEVASLRPNIDKEKYLKTFEKNRRLKEITVAFTVHSLRSVYYSKNTKAFHVTSIGL